LKSSYERDLQKRPVKATYQKDLQKKPMKETNKRTGYALLIRPKGGDLFVCVEECHE